MPTNCNKNDHIMTPKVKPWDKGYKILNRYEIIDIKKGGMGIVYIVRDREWDRIFACEFMPASANLMDAMLDFAPSFTQRGADYILANWSNYDLGNSIQSVLVPVVSKMYGTAQGTALIDDIVLKNKFDSGTNNFILRYINFYGENQRH